MSKVDRNQVRQDVSDAHFVARKTLPAAVVYVVLALLVLAVIGGVVYGMRVLFSGPKGAGDQIRITNDGRNRVNAQEWFAAEFEEIKSADRRIGPAAAALKAHPGDGFYETNYTGLVNRCMAMVGAYNGEAAKVSRGQWRDAGLPAQIDNNDPATDCHEDAK